MTDKEIAAELLRRGRWEAFARPVHGWPSGVLVVGGKIYGVCAECHSLVRVNKPILGSLHLCAEERSAEGVPCDTSSPQV